MLLGICKFLSGISVSLRKEWDIQNAAPISFDAIEGLDQQEIQSLSSVYSNFIRDAENGMFDEGAQNQLRKFLTRQGFEAPQIEKSIRDLAEISAVENVKIRKNHASTQDQYWDATGLKDTRPTIATTILPGRFD